MSDFWTKRRAAVAAEEDALPTVQPAAKEASPEQSDEELLEELGLPDPDGMGPEDDFTQFLTETVPARLKTRALRRLWRVNPVLANLDGLVDYGEDFTDGAMVVENLQTAYHVGKGMLKHVEELARQAEADAETDRDDDEPAEDPVVAEAVETAPRPEEVEAVSTVSEPALMTITSADEELASSPAPRRMQFTFEEATPA